MIVAQDEICLITFLNSCTLSVSPQTAVGFPRRANVGLLDDGTERRNRGSGRRNECFETHFHFPLVEGYFHPLHRVSLFFSPSVYSYGESQGRTDTNITVHSLDSTSAVAEKHAHRRRRSALSQEISVEFILMCVWMCQNKIKYWFVRIIWSIST